jgi:D-alanyl-D-alanine carboxypeptidase/D-alanyl-D-alanine-endopeptidase (penicillin-binding protein 4)
MTLSDSSSLHITGVVPEECEFEFSNWLVAAGTADQGYVFAAPYSTNGWLSGSIPVNTDDFYLKASIADPPRLMSRMFDKKLKEAGITVSGEPTTTRLMQTGVKESINPITSITSPHLKEIIETLNHQSVNMYAEHLVKEIGKVFRKSGSTAAGINVITDFLNSAGINNPGMFIEDGSGLSPFNAVNSEGIASLLVYMKYAGKYFEDYFNSLPEAGKEGTLNRYFRDPVFESRLSAKSGSMTRVRSYAGYLTTLSGKELVFSVIVNNFTGTSGAIVPFIEDILRETINTR